MDISRAALLQETLKDAYETLLLSYAAGLLDQAQNLIVASHVALSPEAREKVHACEALGGVLMEKYCEPVSMSRQSLTSVLDRLDALENPEDDKEMIEFIFPEELEIPLCLKRTVACHVQHIRWQRLCRGVKGFDLALECKESKARFLRADKGVRAPPQASRGMELTLVLDGALADETGLYQRGALVIADERHRRPATSCCDRGGFYMVVSSAPAPVGSLHRLLNSLFRF